MFKKILLCGLLAGAVVFAKQESNWCQTVEGMGRSQGVARDTFAGDPDGRVPWPWSLTQPFPWTDINGLWRTDDGEFDYVFAFKVMNSSAEGARYLQVQQIDLETCLVVGHGVGYQNTSSKIIRGVMSSSEGSYRFVLRAFLAEDSPAAPVGKIKNGYVMVMTITQPQQQTNNKPFHVQIGKVSNKLMPNPCFLSSFP